MSTIHDNKSARKGRRYMYSDYVDHVGADERASNTAREGHS